MAMARYSAEPIVEIPIDLDQLATQSDLYKALVEFHGTDAINVLTYPIGSPFSKQCFSAVLHNLGSMEEFSATLKLFPIGELLRVALYLGSDTLLYHVVFDTLNSGTAVTILELAIDTLGMDHYITDTVIQFIHLITNDSPANIIRYMGENKMKLRIRIKNNIKSSGKFITRYIMKPVIATEFMNSLKKPDICLLCMLPITGYNTKTLAARLVPMGCCGMMVHLECQKLFLKRPNLPNCPACQTTYQHGKIDPEYRDLGNVLTICNLDHWHILPLPYRRCDINWPKSTAAERERYSIEYTNGFRPG